MSDGNDASSAVDEAGFAGGIAGAEGASRFADAADAAREGMDSFRRAVEAVGERQVDQAKGNLFEYIEQAKFNIDSALNGSDLEAQVTEELGRPHAAADVEVYDADQELQSRAQMKANKRVTRSASDLADEKYDNMDKVVPSDRAERVRELSEKRAESEGIYASKYRDNVENVTGETSHGEVSSGGTEYEEIKTAAEESEEYARQFETRQIVQEVSEASKQGALGGAFLGGAISVAQNSVRVYRGESDLGEAAMDVGVSTAKSGARGAAIGGGGAIIRNVAAKHGSQVFSRSNVATAVAGGVLDAGRVIYSYATGELEAEEAVVEIGQSGAETVSSIYVGAAGGAAFGPVGAVVGGMAGYLTATQCYSTIQATLKRAEIEKERARKLRAVAEEARKRTRERRERLQADIADAIEANNEHYSQCFEAIDDAMEDDAHGRLVSALSDLSGLVGTDLEFKNFEEFDEFMLESDEPLVI